MKEIFSADVIKTFYPDYANGMVKTLNKTGYMRNYLGQLDERFVEESSNAHGYVADIGCGVGAVLCSLLNRGVKNIVGVDIDEKQLDIIKILLNPLEQENPSLRVELICDSLPKLRKLDKKNFSFILCGQVLHYMQPHEFTEALARLYDLLENGGKLYITIMSERVGKYKDFTEEYERRRCSGIKFPGFMENPSQYNKTGIQHHPGFFLCFDPTNLHDRVSDAGFKVLEVFYLNDTNNKEGLVGLIAIKD